MMLIRIENGKPTARWGRKARGLTLRRLGYRNRDPHTDDGREPRKSRRSSEAVFTGAVVVLTIAIALPGLGTSEARIDPNRYGLRTVDAAGGSSATVEVRFTVRPVILLVVDSAGRPLQLWTNIAGTPARSQLGPAGPGLEAELII